LVKVYSLYPLFFSDISNCEVVTAWAGGCSWSEALELSGAAPGDLARTLSRALDAMRQLGNVPFTPIRKYDLDGKGSPEPRGLHPDIRRLCREAARAINRYPVKDTLSFESSTEDDDNDKEDDDLDDDNKEDDDLDDDKEGDDLDKTDNDN
jgi:hypothetical protein